MRRIVNNTYLRIVLALWMAFSLSFAESKLWAFDLPKPNQVLSLTAPKIEGDLLGIKLKSNKPYEFSFLYRKELGVENVSQAEMERLTKYFFTSLTIPEADLWVNLSPYEKDKIISQELGLTGMGRDLLALDYVLKNLSASLLHPDQEIGHKFWEKLYLMAKEKGWKDLSQVEHIHKIWILPETVVIGEKMGQEGDHQILMAYIKEARLKVMLDQDYLAMKGLKVTKESNEVFLKLMREMIVPLIEKEVNEGEHFARLRQIYHSLILGNWYKEKLGQKLFNSDFINQKKIKGLLDEQSPVSELTYKQYLRSVKSGPVNLIKEEEGLQGSKVVRKYFSGGITGFADLKERTKTLPLEKAVVGQEGLAMMVFDVKIKPSLADVNQAMQANSLTGIKITENILKEILLQLKRMKVSIADMQETIDILKGKNVTANPLLAKSENLVRQNLMKSFKDIISDIRIAHPELEYNTDAEILIEIQAHMWAESIGGALAGVIGWKSLMRPEQVKDFFAKINSEDRGDDLNRSIINDIIVREKFDFIYKQSADFREEVLEYILYYWDKKDNPYDASWRLVYSSIFMLNKDAYWKLLEFIYRDMILKYASGNQYWEVEELQRYISLENTRAMTMYSAMVDLTINIKDKEMLREDREKLKQHRRVYEYGIILTLQLAIYIKQLQEKYVKSKKLSWGKIKSIIKENVGVENEEDLLEDNNDFRSEILRVKQQITSNIIIRSDRQSGIEYFLSDTFESNFIKLIDRVRGWLGEDVDQDEAMVALNSVENEALSQLLGPVFLNLTDKEKKESSYEHINKITKMFIGPYFGRKWSGLETETNNIISLAIQAIESQWDGKKISEQDFRFGLMNVEQRNSIYEWLGTFATTSNEEAAAVLLRAVWLSWQDDNLIQEEDVEIFAQKIDEKRKADPKTKTIDMLKLYRFRDLLNVFRKEKSLKNLEAILRKLNNGKKSSFRKQIDKVPEGIQEAWLNPPSSVGGIDLSQYRQALRVEKDGRKDTWVWDGDLEGLKGKEILGLDFIIKSKTDIDGPKAFFNLIEK